ncbi:hypothetical protein L9F63_019450, partial [Diploptera punctata]
NNNIFLLLKTMTFIKKFSHFTITISWEKNSQHIFILHYVYPVIADDDMSPLYEANNNSKNTYMFVL